jgi:hypothetical protein
VGCECGVQCGGITDTGTREGCCVANQTKRAACVGGGDCGLRTVRVYCLTGFIHSRMPLSFTPLLLRLKLLPLGCSLPLTGWHGELCPNAEGTRLERCWWQAN